jgi:hypothetical protein
MPRLERELLEECRTIAAHSGAALVDVLRDCHRFWITAGRALQPRGWVARANAAKRLLARHSEQQQAV